MNCDNCPAKQFRTSFVPGGGNLNAEIILVGDFPAPGEVGSKLNFTGQAGNPLWDILKEMGLTRADVFTTNALKCFVEKAKIEVYRCCYENLKEEINACKNRRLIVALGDGAFKALCPEVKTGIMANSGKIIWNVEFQTNVLVCINPTAALRDAKNYPLFKASLMRIKTPAMEFKKPTIINVKHINQILHLQGREVAADIETNATLDWLDPNSRITHIGLFEGNISYLCGEDIVYSPLFVDVLEQIRLIWHNGTFDTKFIRAKLGKWVPIERDTMLEGYVMNECMSSVSKEDDKDDGRYGLERLATLYLGAEPWKSEMKKSGFNYTSEEMAIYLTKDIYWLWHLDQIWKKHMPDWFYTLLVPGYIQKTKEIEYKGVNFDRVMCNQVHKVATRKLNKMIKSLQFLVKEKGIEFSEIKGKKKPHKVIHAYNPDSPVMNKVVFEKMSGRKVKKCDDEFVQSVLNRCPTHSFFLPYRNYKKLSKLISTFYTDKHVCIDGLLHPQMNVHGTVTGRFSSSHPNMQNRPKSTRRLIIPDAGHKWLVSSDYSQIEIKVPIAIFGLTDLIELMNQGIDLHTISAMNFFKKPADQITKAERHVGKNGINFPLQYGQSIEAMRRNLAAFECVGRDVSMDEVYDIRRNHYSERLKPHMEKVIKEAIKNGYVQTPFGRKRRFPFINRYNYEETKRQIANTFIQSTAHDCTLSSFIILARELPIRFDARIINEIHDDCLSSVSEKDVEAVMSYCKEVMERKFHFSDLIFTVEVKKMERWK